LLSVKCYIVYIGVCVIDVNICESDRYSLGRVLASSVGGPGFNPW